jgi:uncharacterized protein with PQ loop repeat
MEKGKEKYKGKIFKLINFLFIIMIIGAIGLILLAIGWLSEIGKIIKEKKGKLDLKFAVLYTIGSLCLVIYSIQVNNIIFIILNGIVMLLSLTSLVYSFKK